MKRVSILLTTIALAFAVSVMAIEPSSVIVAKDGKQYYKHLVERGHTLYSISKAYNVTEQQITEANGGLTAEMLRAGDYILVPRIVAETEDAQPEGGKREKRGGGKFTTHVVKAGDTIYSIARKYKISVAVLESDNPEIDIERITVGAEIKVRRAESGYSTTEDIERERKEREAKVELKPYEHRVVAGETVYSLSRRYGLGEREFMELNGMKKSSNLKVGMIVKTRPIAEAEAASAESTTTAEVPVAEVAHPASEDSVVADSVVMDVPYDGLGTMDGDTTIIVRSVDVSFPPLAKHHTLKMALMLPFHQNDRVAPNYVDFYRGVLLAMEDLKAEGLNIELSVFDTCGDSSRINDIVSYEEGFLDAQLIVGPVYEAEFPYILAHAEANGVPVVSPLADIKALQSPVLFQMQAEGEYKDDNLANIFDGSREVVRIYAQTAGSALASEEGAHGAALTGYGLNFVFDRESFFYERNADGTNGAEVDIVEFMRTRSAKAFVIVANNETDVDRILTTLASTKASIEGRGMLYGDYVVVGNRKWKQSANIDHQLFFRNNAIFVVPYHANRSSEAIRLFDSRYITAYEALPSMYSYRGYDAAMIFCRKMFTGIDATLFDESFMPLATPYKFSFEGGIYLNTRWVREHYKSNFTIDVE